VGGLFPGMTVDADWFGFYTKVAKGAKGAKPSADFYVPTEDTEEEKRGRAAGDIFRHRLKRSREKYLIEI
jgi:hypothetical protein